MPNSLRVKFGNMRYKGRIDEAEYQALIKKLDGHDKQIIREFVENLSEKMQKVHMGDNAWCEYHADEFIDEMENTAEEMLKKNMWRGTEE